MAAVIRRFIVFCWRRAREFRSRLMRVSLGRDDDTDGGGKRDAHRAAAEVIAEVERGGHRSRGRQTVAELLERGMAHIEAQGRADSTLARYRSCISANIKPRLEPVK